MDAAGLELRDGALRVEVRPDLGGAVSRFSLAGIDLMRPTAGDARHPRDLAMWAMLPWTNRISGGGFSFAGRFVAVPANLEGEACPIHGTGWLRRWRVVERSATRVRLVTTERRCAPFAYRAEQEHALVAGALLTRLAVTHLGPRPLPYGLGLHPWFPRTPGTTLEAVADTLWLEGPGHLPTVPVELPAGLDFSTARRLPEGWTNNAFTGWTGRARISWPEHGVALTIEASPGLATFMLYTPPGARFWCFEPASHVPDAHHRDRCGLVVLERGARLEATVRFRPERQG